MREQKEPLITAKEYRTAITNLIASIEDTDILRHLWSITNDICEAIQKKGGE